MGLRGATARIRTAGRAAAGGAVICAAAAWAALATEIEFAFGPDAGLARDLQAVSALAQAEADGTTDPQDLFAAARAEYGRLLGALYARGHYSGVIRVLVDGREAAGIAPLDAPARIGRIAVTVDPGPSFAFATARVAPLAPGTALPPLFAPGRPAESGLVAEAAQAGIDGWRDAGHAKAGVAAQDLVADHRARTLSADIRLDPGPRLRFGTLRFAGQERMRPERLAAIAGFPAGRTFSPGDLALVADRLRRTGVFRSVVLAEAGAVTPPDLLDITATLIEERRRRYEFGAELSSLDGATLSALWLHRNLWGGAERLTVTGEIAQIGAQTSGIDYALGVTFARPATFTPDTTLSLSAELEHLDEADYTADTATAGIALSHRLSERLTLGAGLDYAFSDVDDVTGDYRYRSLALPLTLVWDSRDKPLDARRGTFLDLEVKPFLGLEGTGSGLRVAADARAYRSFGTGGRVTLAARLQAGLVTGPSLLETPRQDLFWSGGGGTVRGQPYQSLGVSILRSDFRIGGQAFLAASAEARVRVTDRIGVVGFVDWGHVGALDFFDDLGDSHAGAGLGLRYDAGFAPIRLDVAAPIAGNTGEGVQIYVGIGQAF